MYGTLDEENSQEWYKVLFHLCAGQTVSPNLNPNVNIACCIKEAAELRTKWWLIQERANLQKEQQNDITIDWVGCTAGAECLQD